MGTRTYNTSLPFGYTKIEKKHASYDPLCAIFGHCSGFEFCIRPCSGNDLIEITIIQHDLQRRGRSPELYEEPLIRLRSKGVWHCRRGSWIGFVSMTSEGEVKLLFSTDKLKVQ